MTESLTTDSRPGPIWDEVIGQTDAVRRLRSAADRGAVHAYLFAGPAGSTKLQAARAFATRLLTGAEDADHRDAVLILRGEHPDVREVRRTGARIDADQARAIIHEASLTPVGGLVQGDDPRRVPPARTRGRGTAPEDHRGAARLDHLPDPRRLRPARPDHDLVAMRPDRLPSDRRRRDRRPARRPRVSRPLRRWPLRGPPTATSNERGCSPPTPRSPNVAMRSPKRRTSSTARAPWRCAPPRTCSASSMPHRSR